jgi:hypothetical protein
MRNFDFFHSVFSVLNLRKYISPVDCEIASNIQEIVESAKLKRSKEALTVMNTVTASVSGENLENSRCKMQHVSISLSLFNNLRQM